MTIPLAEYAKISDNLCVCYFGNKVDNIDYLIRIRPSLESKYIGIKIYYAFRGEMLQREELSYLLKNEDRIVSQENLASLKRTFAYVIDLTRTNVSAISNTLEKL